MPTPPPRRGMFHPPAFPPRKPWNGYSHPPAQRYSGGGAPPYAPQRGFAFTRFSAPPFGHHAIHQPPRAHYNSIGYGPKGWAQQSAGRTATAQASKFKAKGFGEKKNYSIQNIELNEKEGEGESDSGNGITQAAPDESNE